MIEGHTDYGDEEPQVRMLHRRGVEGVLILGGYEKGGPKSLGGSVGGDVWGPNGCKYA